jgi:hypothetical protein
MGNRVTIREGIRCYLKNCRGYHVGWCNHFQIKLGYQLNGLKIEIHCLSYQSIPEEPKVKQYGCYICNVLLFMEDTGAHQCQECGVFICTQHAYSDGGKTLCENCNEITE